MGPNMEVLCWFVLYAGFMSADATFGTMKFVAQMLYTVMK